MVFNATFNNISVISWRSVLLIKESGVPGEKHLSPRTNYHIMLYQVHLAMSRIQTLVMIGTDCTINPTPMRPPRLQRCPISHLQLFPLFLPSTLPLFPPLTIHHVTLMPFSTLNHSPCNHCTISHPLPLHHFPTLNPYAFSHP